MNRTPVESTNLSSVGYDPDTLTLEAEFRDGSVYQYFDVPEHVHLALTSGESVGKYFAANVRGIYRYARL